MLVAGNMKQFKNSTILILLTFFLICDVSSNAFDPPVKPKA